MGFGAEMKDFIDGFKVGTKFWDDVEDNKKSRAERDKIRKPTDEEIDAIPDVPAGTNRVREKAPSSGYDYSDIDIKDDPEAAQVLGFVRKYEGGEQDPYNKLVGGSTKPLTSMSVAEVLDYQKQMLDAGHESTALGAYQFINPTLAGLVKDGVVDINDPFDQTTQDQLGYALLQRRGWNDYKEGKIDKDKLMNNLAGEWAALPLENGKSAYAGVGSNAAGVDRDTYAAAIPDFGGGTTQTAEGDVLEVPEKETAAIPAPAKTAPKQKIEPAIPVKTPEVAQTALPGVPDDGTNGEFVNGVPDEVEEDIEEPEFDENGEEVGFLEDRQRIYGGVNANPMTAMSRPVLSAADGGAIPNPRQVDPFNAGRDVTAISSAKPTTGFVARRVGAAPSTPAATAGPTASQLKFREAQARAAIPAPVAAAQPAQTNNPFGWNPREGAPPPMTGFKPGQLDQYSDQQLKQRISDLYGGVPEARGNMTPQQRQELLQYGRWRLGQSGYDSALARSSVSRSNYMQARNDRGSSRFAEGGMVPEYEQVARVEEPAAPQAAIPAPGAQAPVPVPAPKPVAGPTGPLPPEASGAAAVEKKEKLPANPRTKKIVSKSLDAGVKFLTNHFQLKPQGAVAGPQDGPNADAGAQRFASGEGAASREEIQAIDDRIDPDRRLSEGDRQQQRLSKTVQWYLQQGRGKEASAVAASLMQYGAARFSQLGSLAGAAYRQYEQTGDPQHLDHTLKFLDKAYEMVPDGASFDIAVDPKSRKIIATRTDDEGDTQEYAVTPEELPGIVQSVQNKSLYWEQIYELADPAGARQKRTSESAEKRNKETLKFREKQTRYTQDQQNRRTAATQSGADRRARETAERADKRARENREAVSERTKASTEAANMRQDKSIKAANERQDKALKARERPNLDPDFDAIQGELSAAELAKKDVAGEVDGAQDNLNEQASRLFDKLPARDRMKRMGELGFPEETWDYVAKPKDGAVPAPRPAPKGGPVAEAVKRQTGENAGANIGAMAKQPAPSDAYTGTSAPTNVPQGVVPRQAKDGAWWFKNPKSGKWAYVTKG